VSAASSGPQEPVLRTRPFPSLLFALLVLLLAGPALRGEEIFNAKGYFIDLPEGFQVVGGDKKNNIQFTDPFEGAMTFAIFAYDPGRFAGAGAIADNIENQLKSRGDRTAFTYEGREAVFLNLSFGGNSGMAVTIAGRPATGSGAPESSYALVVWVEASRFDNWAGFMLSSLDCFSIDRVAKRSPGPVSQFLSPFPAKRNETRKVKFGGKNLELPWNADEAVEIADTAGREFNLVKSYTNGDEALFEAAWARSYRMIWRESARRLDRFAAEIDPLLPDNPTDAARALLNWVQDFHYERDLQGIDFVDPLSAAFEGRGDCDSRAMLMSVILERRGIDTILMLSSKYKHAMAAFDVPGGGQRFGFDGKDWLVGETTAHVGLGMIAQEQADWSNWMGVRFGN